jgi:hypothetical protein
VLKHKGWGQAVRPSQQYCPAAAEAAVVHCSQRMPARGLPLCHASGLDNARGGGLRGTIDAMHACAAAGGWLQQEADALAPEDIEFSVVSEKQVRPRACMPVRKGGCAVHAGPRAAGLVMGAGCWHPCWPVMTWQGVRLCPAVPGSVSNMALPVLLV